MGYTQDDFEEWLILIDFKMDYFTGEFAKEQNLKLDYSIESLDELEGWILANYKEIKDLIADSKMLDYLTIYIGETFRKYIGGKWYIDLKNKKFGKLTVIERAPASNEKEAMWKCQCDCGNIVVTRGSSLRCGASKTCGCSRIEWSQTGNAKRTHGSTGERLYRVWVGMRQR